MTDSNDSIVLMQRLEANEIKAWRSAYHTPSAEIAASLGIGYFEQDGVLQIWNRSARTQLLNRVLGLGLFAPATDELLDALLARSQAVTRSFYIQLVPQAQPPDLATRLKARGLRRDPDWLMHYCTLPSSLPDVSAPPGYHIERLTSPLVAAWADTLLTSWGMPVFAAAGSLAIFLPMLDNPNWSYFAAIHTASGQVVGSASLFGADATAGLYADGVRPEHRRRGLQQALIAARLAEAQQRGYEMVCTQTLPDHSAAHNMERFGFKVAYSRANYTMPK